MKRAFLPLLLTAAVSASPASADRQLLLKTGFTGGVLSVPAAETPPVIDGTCGSDWRVFTELRGFSGGKRLLLAGRQGKVRLCRDDKHLYLAVITSTPSNDPGGSLLTSARGRDSAVYGDDSVEIYLKNGKTGHILIANAANAVYDAKYEDDGKNKNAAWDFKDVRIASQVEFGWWTLELAIPLREIGSPEEIKMNVMRNWSGLGASSLNYTPRYLNEKYMFTAKLTGKSPAVRELAWGEPENGRWSFAAQTDDPAEEPLVFSVLLHHNEKKGVVTDGESSAVIPSGGQGKVSFDAEVKSGNIRMLTLLLRGKDSGRIFHARRVMVQKGAALGRRPVTGTFSVPGLGSGQMYLLPGYGKLAVEFRPAAGKGLKGVAGNIRGSRTVPFTSVRGLWTARLPIPEKPGTYPLDMTFSTGGAEVRVEKGASSVTIRRFGWEKNDIGKARIILPPFTPLETTQDTVKNLTSLRKISPQGLYSSLVTEGREMLAGPMTFSLTVDGKPEVLRAGNSRLDRDATGYAATSVCVSKTDSDVSLTTRGHFEYDGFHWLAVDLEAPRKCTVDRLTITLPLKDAEVPFFHAVANELRTNPAGALPRGEGLLWGGSKLPRKKHFGEELLHPQMVPYLWLGAESRGLSWFMDSTFGCKLDRTKDAVRILRRNGVVSVEIDLVNRPVVLDGKKRTIEFGFHPTPVKPVTGDLRKVFYDCEGKSIPGAYRAQFILPDCTVNFPSRWSKYPLNKDYSHLTAFTDILKNGEQLPPSYRQGLTASAPEIEKLLKKFPGGREYAPRQQKQITAFLKLYTASRYRGKTLPFAYFDHRLEFLGDPEPEYYKSEWWNPAGHSYFAALRTTMTPSNVDYLVYYLSKAVEAGLHGINLDDAYLMPDTNVHTVGRIDDEGEIHASAGILALRELLNRLAVVLHEKNKYPMVLNVHMTDALLVPCFAKVTVQTGFELKYGENPHQERFTPEYIRTVGLGTKIGAESLMLRGILRKKTPIDQWKKKENALLRNLWGVMLPHGIRHANSQTDEILMLYRKLVDFGICEEDCTFVPYWEKKNDLKAGGVLVSSYRRPGKTLVILSNYFDSKARSVKLDIDRGAPGLKNKPAAADLETGRPVDLEKEINIQGYDFRLIQLTHNTGGTK
ncbi:MAG: hypothetical protein IJS01_14775 [Lentisphaeria bacterium]|nr:hypothetical protein [Lentisphaeria bacterium]